MYGYEEYIEVTPDQLLQKVTQQEIFEFILEQPFNLSTRYVSPFRTDRKPGCRFEQRPDGAILFIDFGEKYLNPTKTHRTVFAMVMDKFSVDLTGAIRILCNKFGLSTSPADYKEPIKINYERSNRVSFETTIAYEPRPYSKQDSVYWSQYMIKTGDLLEDHVFASDKFIVRTERKHSVITIYKHCYIIDFIHHVKVYQPYSLKYKWITNCDENDIGNFDNLPATGDELIIKKSYKDHRVLRNLNIGLHVIWFQNEGCIPSIEILKNLIERFKLITIFYDNDEDGIIAAQKLLDIFNMLRPGHARMVYLPRIERHKQLFGNYLKDPGEFVHREGKQDLITVLKSINVL